MIKPKLPKLTQKQQNKSILARQNFFDKQVKMEEWKNSMAGQNEVKVIKILNSLDFILGRDFVRQHPIGERFVIDIAFIKEKVAIEVDGKSHENKKQKTLDKMRDKFLRDNDWIPLRISDKEMFGYKKLYHKYRIKEIIGERRSQWEVGQIGEREIKNFIKEDYELYTNLSIRNK